jgi:hypothetical protein
MKKFSSKSTILASGLDIEVTVNEFNAVRLNYKMRESPGFSLIESNF